MKFINLGSYNSQFRGLEYYQEKRVSNINQVSEVEYTSNVNGYDNNYNVFINIKNPRKSTCDCPFALGRRVICKHMIATYFTIFPQKEKEFNDDLIRGRMEYEEECERLRNEEIKSITSYVNSLSAKEVRQKLIEKLIDEYDDRDNRKYW